MELMVVLGILGIVSYFGMTSLMSFLNSQKNVDTKLTLSQLRDNIRNTILNGGAWANTVTSATNPDMVCLRDSTSCIAYLQPGVFYFNLYDQSASPGALFINSTSGTAGFTDAGAPCNTWSATGNPSCPIRVRLRWNSICTGTCINPQVVVTGRFEYSIPAELQSKRTPLNMDNYNILVYKSNGTMYEPMILQYVESDNSGEGACTKGAWTVRKINREFMDASDNVTIDSVNNTFTLKAGTYTCNISAPSFKIQNTTLRLMKLNPAPSVFAYGRGVLAGPNITYATLDTLFTIATDSTFQIEQSCSATGSDYTYGSTNSLFDFGVPIDIPTLGYAYDIVYTTTYCVRIN